MNSPTADLQPASRKIFTLSIGDTSMTDTQEMSSGMKGGGKGEGEWLGRRVEVEEGMTKNHMEVHD